MRVVSPLFREDLLVTAIIPARGGSKRIPRKNVRPFMGKPIIAYSIEAARASGLFERVLVSTDDDEIAQVAMRFGADGNIPRADYLAGDHATLGDVMAFSADVLSQDDPLCCILATAPLIRAEDLQAGWELMLADIDFAFSATDYAFPVQRSLVEASGGGVEMLFPEHRLTRSQDLPKALHDAGQFYFGTAAAWREKAPIFSERARAVMLPRLRVIDIDTEEDWEIAERLAAVLRSYS